LAAGDASILSVKANVKGANRAVMTAEIQVHDLEHLYRIMARINTVKGVMQVERGGCRACRRAACGLGECSGRRGNGGRGGFGDVRSPRCLREDTDADVTWMAEKIATLRIFEDAEGKLNRSLGM
jgi:hypothetical protein